MNVKLLLFIAGKSGLSQQALAWAKSLRGAEVEVIDVQQSPQRADEYCVVATPTMIRLSPPPGETGRRHRP